MVVVAGLPRRKGVEADVLLVSDDLRTSRLVRALLQSEGYTVAAVAHSGAVDAVESRSSGSLILLDFQPGGDGCGLCRRIRDKWQTPIVVLTPQGNENRGIDALDAGADDFLVKPFIPRELTARVIAILRRCQPREDRPQAVYHHADLTVDFIRKRVMVGQQEIELAPVEYRILICLAQNAGAVVASQHLMQAIWGDGSPGRRHLLQANVSRLRKKLRDGAEGARYIRTRHGMGYVMAATPA